MKLRLLLLLHLLNVLAFAFWGPLFALYAFKLGASPALAGTLYGFYTLFHAGTILLFGWLDHRTNRFMMVTVGYIIQGLNALVFLSISSPIGLLIPLSIAAVSGGMIAPAWGALFTTSVQSGKEGSGWSYYDAGQSLVISAGVFLAGFLASWYGYQAIFMPLFVVNLLAAIVAISYRHRLS